MKKIPLAPYPRELWVCESPEEYNAYAAEIGVDSLHSESRGRQLTHDRQYVVWADSPETLVHELSHVALDLFSWMNADPRECNHEPFCYLMQHMYQQATQ